VVGVGGFEPPAPASQTRCADQLRYTPSGVSIMRRMKTRQAAFARPFLPAAALLWLALLPACTPAEAAPPPATPLSSPAAAAAAAPAVTETPPTPTSPPACRDQTGVIETGSLQTALLPHGRLDFRVYLPPCYAAEESRRYPVLYLLHGLGADDDQWARLGATETADRLITSGQAPPFLIVMPRDRSFLQPFEDGFDEALTELLIPHVDAAYHTRADRDGRAVGGLSRGGGWAVHLGLTRPDLFAAVGVHSPAIFHSDAHRLEPWLADLPAGQEPRLYVDSGDNDGELRLTLTFVDLLARYGLLHEWHLYPGYHEEDYWRGRLEEYLRWYAAGW
jgi:enterochelin esterase-like enzyme